MSKITKSKINPMKKIIMKQDAPKRPPTLGEPTMVTDWTKHINEKHKIRHFAQIRDEKDGRKQAYVTTPNLGTYFIAAKEDYCGYYYIWLFCIQESTGRIVFRINSSDVGFVLWDVPEVKEEKNDTVTA